MLRINILALHYKYNNNSRNIKDYGRKNFKNGIQIPLRSDGENNEAEAS